MQKEIGVVFLFLVLIGALVWINRSTEPIVTETEEVPEPTPTEILQSSPTKNASPSAKQTEIIQFDPTTIKIDKAENPVDVSCTPSDIVTNNIVFSCASEPNDIWDPCFLVEDNLLICRPDLSADSDKPYDTLARTTSSLPISSPAENVPVAIYVELDTEDLLGCRLVEQVKLGDYQASYKCASKNTWIVNLQTSEDIMTAELYINDPLVENSTATLTSKNIIKLWVY